MLSWDSTMFCIIIIGFNVFLFTLGVCRATISMLTYNGYFQEYILSMNSRDEFSWRLAREFNLLSDDAICSWISFESFTLKFGKLGFFATFYLIREKWFQSSRIVLYGDKILWSMANLGGRNFQGVGGHNYTYLCIM